MSTVDEIKTAAASLPVAQKVDLYRWLNGSDEVRNWQRDELQREIQKGIDALERGEAVPLDIEVVKGDGRRLTEEVQARNA